MDSSAGKECKQGWVELTCKYPEPKTNYASVVEIVPKKTETENNEWEKRVILYHNNINQILRVVIIQPNYKDYSKFKCQFDHRPKTKEQEFKAGKRQSLFHKT